MNNHEFTETTPAQPLLPLLRARTWSVGFLALAIVLAFVFAQTMPEFFQAAHS
ncbi:hypothetical protein HQ32_02645 [Prauserella sp. Am3]|nr:hypothetical protein HQ32_02645 [Prauserella sp. Am3]